MASSADVPDRFDLVINGQGYMLDKSYDDSPYRKPPAEYGYTPTFLERTNVGSQYGDDTQAFFLTASQNNWDLGEARRYFRSADADGVRRYFTGSNVDPVTVPGQVSLARSVSTLTAPAAIYTCCSDPAGIFCAGATNLYLLNSAGSFANEGAHGLGVDPNYWAICSDTESVYLSTTKPSSVGIRSYNRLANTWATFSTTPVDSLAFMNNVIYGYSEVTASLYSFTSAGVANLIFTWKDGQGNALVGDFGSPRTRLKPYGGTLLILRCQGGSGGGELWQFDGSNTSQLAGFPTDFVARELEIVSGVAFISGYIDRGIDIAPAIYYYLSGTVGLLWASNVSGFTDQSLWPAMSGFGTGLLFTDDTRGNFMEYNISLGGAHVIGSYTVTTNSTPMLAANSRRLFHSRKNATSYQLPATTVASSGFICTSLFDFDNSLVKLMRGVKVEFDVGSDGNGGSVDIYYQFDSVDGAYTLLQTGAVSGTEYDLGSAQHHSVSIKVVLNRGTSTYGPKLKRTYVRAAPILQSFRNNNYLIDLTGNSMADPPMYLTLVNGETHAKDGEQMRADLQAAIAAGPITITDRFGTFMGIVEPGGSAFREVRADYGRAEYRAALSVREI